MRNPLILIILIASLSFSSGCTRLQAPPTETPIPYETFGNISAASHVTVLLPGIKDRIGTFVDEGFVDIAKPLLEEFPHSALITVDAHFGYYLERNIHIRLAEDLLIRYPDKKFTFVGISLGGLASLLVAEEHSQRIDKLIMLSPFLGDDGYEFLGHLQSQGPHDSDGDDDIARTLNRIWRYLLSDGRQIPVYVAYGQDDKFVPYYDHLRAQKPGQIQFLEIRGGHDWNTWRVLWKALAPIAVGQF